MVDLIVKVERQSAAIQEDFENNTVFPLAAINHTLDMFVRSPLKICGDVEMPIHHQLLDHLAPAAASRHLPSILIGVESYNEAELRRIGKVVSRGGDLFMQQSEFAKIQAAVIR